MSKTPTKQLSNAYFTVMNTNRNLVQFAKFSLQYHETDTNEYELTLVHYGVLILIIRHNKNKMSWDISLGSCAYSATDRNNINGLLKLEGIHNVKATMIDGCLRLCHCDDYINITY